MGKEGGHVFKLWLVKASFSFSYFLFNLTKALLPQALWTDPILPIAGSPHAGVLARITLLAPPNLTDSPINILYSAGSTLLPVS